jgi:hypothetical protein
MLFLPQGSEIPDIFDQCCGSGFNDFVDPDPWTRKNKKKISLFLHFLNIFTAKGTGRN